MKFEEWLAQQDGVIEVDCGCVTTEAFYYWLRAAYEAGNSPVTAKSLGCERTLVLGKWIPVSERLPDENAEQQILACFKGGDISTLYYFEGRWDDAYGIVPIRQDVTHWMPLPAGPKEQDNV